MKLEKVFETHMVQLDRRTFARVEPNAKDSFACDWRLEETIRLLNRKGYFTNCCCEGHPMVDENGCLHMGAGYIAFFRPLDRKLIGPLLPQEIMMCGAVGLYWQVPNKEFERYYPAGAQQSVCPGGRGHALDEEGRQRLWRWWTRIWDVLLLTAQLLPDKREFCEQYREKYGCYPLMQQKDYVYYDPTVRYQTYWDSRYQEVKSNVSD